jgi:hypothetical protein
LEICAVKPSEVGVGVPSAGAKAAAAARPAKSPAPEKPGLSVQYRLLPLGSAVNACAVCVLPFGHAAHRATALLVEMKEECAAFKYVPIELAAWRLPGPGESVQHLQLRSPPGPVAIVK